jgi:hypothetical protein
MNLYRLDYVSGGAVSDPLIGGDLITRRYRDAIASAATAAARAGTAVRVTRISGGGLARAIVNVDEYAIVSRIG